MGLKMPKVKLQPKTIELGNSAKDFLAKPRSRRDLADYLAISKESARNILDNHEKIRCVKKAAPGRREESLYVWFDGESGQREPKPAVASPWDVLKR